MEWPRDLGRVRWPNGGSVKNEGGSDYYVPFSLDNLPSKEETKEQNPK